MKCFVIMPISDVEDYAAGHFDRVYEHIIRPSCEKCGLTPYRADDTKASNFIMLDILSRVIEADMVLCDLSSLNPNVLYELGIRQAFGRPVTLVRDKRTRRIFDVSGLRDIEYDDSLRVDTINIAIDSISEMLSETSKDTSGINSLVGLLSIQSASLPSRSEVTKEGALIIRTLNDISHRLATVERFTKPKTRNVSEKEGFLHTEGVYFTAIDGSEYRVGDRVHHPQVGDATVINVHPNIMTLRPDTDAVLLSFVKESDVSLLSRLEA